MSSAPSVTHVHEFDVPVPALSLWPAIADTNHLNELVYGLGRASLLEKRSDFLIARARIAGINMRYEEYPFEFVAPERYASRRVYLNGPFTGINTTVALTEEARGTHVRFQQEFVMRSSTLAPLLKPFVGGQFRGVVKRLERFLKSAVTETGEVRWPPHNPHANAVRARAAPFIDRVRQEAPSYADHLLRVTEHMALYSEGDVARMRPFELADEWNIPRREMLEACLWGAKEGVLKLSWDILCPNCEQPPVGHDALADIPEGAHCEMCDVEFGPQLAQNVEATFSPSPQVRKVERAVFCHGSPSRTRSWLAQFVVGPQAEKTIEVALGPGRYRVQAEGAQSRFLIEVRDEGPSEGTLVIPEGIAGARPRLGGETLVLGPGTVKITVRNENARKHRVQLAHRAFASDAATAADVAALDLFRDLFGADVLAADQHVDVGRYAVLFTDLVGSTAMYERIGDAAAYGLVRKHFDILFAVVEDHGGHVVKTVGDCVMAGFGDPLDAAQAGKACIEGLMAMRDNDGNDPQLGLRVGVHAGPCLAVRANGALDYFGRTVNVAARVEALGETNELVLSSEVLDSPGVREWVRDVEAPACAVCEDRKPVKGVAGELEVLRLQLTAP